MLQFSTSNYFAVQVYFTKFDTQAIKTQIRIQNWAAWQRHIFDVIWMGWRFTCNLAYQRSSVAWNCLQNDSFNAKYSWAFGSDAAIESTNLS